MNTTKDLFKSYAKNWVAVAARSFKFPASKQGWRFTPRYELAWWTWGPRQSSHKFRGKIRIFPPRIFCCCCKNSFFIHNEVGTGKLGFFGGNIISEKKLWHFLFKKSSENYFLTILLPQCACQVCSSLCWKTPLQANHKRFPPFSLENFAILKQVFFAVLCYFIFSNIQNVPSSDWPAIPPRDSKNGMWLTRTKSKMSSLETPPLPRFFRWFFSIRFYKEVIRIATNCCFFCTFLCFTFCFLDFSSMITPSFPWTIRERGLGFRPPRTTSRNSHIPKIHYGIFFEGGGKGLRPRPG